MLGPSAGGAGRPHAKRSAASPLPLARPGKVPLHHAHHHISRMGAWLLLLLGAGCVALLSAQRYLLAAHVLDSPIRPHLDARPLNQRVHTEDEKVLRMVVEECSKGENSTIWIDLEGNMVVQEQVDLSQCPPLDVMLRGEERGIGMCTDAALYVMHVGGRLIPPVPPQQYEAAGCGAATARLFLETMYSGFFSPDPDVLHLQLLNHEHMWALDASLHRRVGAFLCKTAFCLQLMRQHVVRMGYRAHVWFVGHTSSDPTVGARGPRDKEGQGLTFLHVKGKSGLKHSNQLLECWRSDPSLPALTVVGRFSWDEAKDSVAAPNIRFYPPVTESNAKGNATPHISFDHIRALQASTPVHLCPSEREGFGHYINEARASAALVVSTDHPPMNELVTPATGLLVRPDRALSYKEMALGKYAPINAFLTPAQLCEAARAVVALPPGEARARGQRAREAFLQEKAAFLQRMQDLRAFLEQRSIGTPVLDHREALWHHGGPGRRRRAGGGLPGVAGRSGDSETELLGWRRRRRRV